MNSSLVMIVAAAAILYGTPLLFTALGEVLTERGGVLNLGAEGMMLLGAVIAFATVQQLDLSTPVALAIATAAGALAGAAGAALLAFVVITLRGNQIVSGLALTIFAGAAGLSSFLGTTWSLPRNPARHIYSSLDLFGLGDAPIVGPLLFNHSALVYLSWLATIAVGFYVSRTRYGLNLRAVGESPASADAAGIPVVRCRYAHTIVGGAFAGVGGATYSLLITPQWVNGLTGGAGWIAIALVIFAFWRADLCLVGAYLFGAFSGLGFVLQTRGVELAPEILASFPYIMTIVVLVVVSAGSTRRRLGAPAALGIPYDREAR